MINFKRILTIIAFSYLLTACGSPNQASDNDYQNVDRLFAQLESNIKAQKNLKKTHEIDHSRLGLKAGSIMPPARVILFSNAKLESALIKTAPKIALELPLRVLAYKDVKSQEAKIIYNDFDYISFRYDLESLLDKNEIAVLSSQYNQTIKAATHDISAKKTTHFSDNKMKTDGIITITSPYDFATTKKKVLAAISAQDDTVSFGEIDFKANALAEGTNIEPSTLLLFGGPAPGAKAMSKAPTLGLDAFCQKLLLWQDEFGNTYLSFNDLLVLADRQKVNKSLALRVINYRLTDVFQTALE
jgi:uncharacterized protein (DUF302 family)